EHERGEDVEGRLLGQTDQRRQDDLLGMAPEHLEHGLLYDLFRGDQAAEDRRLDDAEADPQSDEDEQQAQQEGNAPAPIDEVGTRDEAEDQNRQVGEQQAGRYAELGPAGVEGTPAVAAQLHGGQHHDAPSTADAV